MEKCSLPDFCEFYNKTLNSV